MNTGTSSMSGNSKPSVSDTQYLHCLRNKVINMLRPKVVLSFLCLFHIFSFLRTRARRGSGSGYPPSAIISCDFHPQRHQSLLCVSSLLSFSRPSLVLSVLPVLVPFPSLPAYSWLFKLIKVTDKTSRGGRKSGRNESQLHSNHTFATRSQAVFFFCFFLERRSGGVIATVARILICKAVTEESDLFHQLPFTVPFPPPSIPSSHLCFFSLLHSS